MSATQTKEKTRRRWTAEQLRKMGGAKRDAILLAAAKRAQRDYRDNRELTAFEAFGEGDVHGDSSNAETR